MGRDTLRPAVSHERSAPVAITDPLAEFARTHTYYAWSDVVDEVFAGDEDAFLDALCGGTMPAAVRRTCEETLGPDMLIAVLLRRVVRQLKTLTAIAAAQTPLLQQQTDQVAELLRISAQPWETLAQEKP